MKNIISYFFKFLFYTCVIILIVMLIYIMYKEWYLEYKSEKETSNFVEEFKKEVAEPTITIIPQETININQEIQENEEISEEIPSEEIHEPTQKPTTKPTNKTSSYNGFNVIGAIEIPKTNVSYPIFSDYTDEALKSGVNKIYGVELNEIGNVVIAGHNLRNGRFFSNNKKLNIGDEIYITDGKGRRIKYIIYNKYETSQSDTKYMNRDTAGKREISLTTCNDDSSARLIILARES